MSYENLRTAVAMSDPEWEGLQQLFLHEGLERCREFLERLDGRFDALQIAHQMHKWIGSAGQLGHDNIMDLARRTERLLLDEPISKADLRERLGDLLLAFSELRNRSLASMPDHVAHALRGKRIALVGFPAERADVACAALGRVDARPRLFSATDGFDSESVGECDLLLVHVGCETDGERLLAAAEGPAAGKLLLTGKHAYLMVLPQALQSLIVDYVADTWEPEEVLLRLTLAVWRRAAAASAAANSHVDTPQTATKTRRPISIPTVLIADDDPIVLTLVRTTLRNFGMQCEAVDNGRDALRMIRETKPNVAVLDVNMPGMDGYEVLSAIRSEGLPTMVVLLTARQQEHDVLRGFQLGADDYLVKPFNPPELVARIKRLLRQTVQVAA